LRGLGVFLAPGFLAGDDLQSGRLVPILTSYRPVEFAINAIYPHRHLVSAKVRAFIGLLAERIVEYRQWLNPQIPEQPSDTATVHSKRLSREGTARARRHPPSRGASG
jgi:LysR substrate binding domain-containing protein